MNRVLIAIGLTLSGFANGQQLLLRADNFENDQGTASFMIYRERDDMPKAPFKIITADIVQGKSEAVVDLPYGDYAIILLQDKNRNGKVDHSFGFPSEPMGYSNGWKLNLFSGMPSFKKLKFTFSAQQPGQTISISY